MPHLPPKQRFVIPNITKCTLNVHGSETLYPVIGVISLDGTVGSSGVSHGGFQKLCLTPVSSGSMPHSVVLHPGPDTVLNTVRAFVKVQLPYVKQRLKHNKI